MNVVVVGAGVNGLAAARSIARRGHEVTVLERFEIGHTNGSSHGPVRIFRAAYEDPAWVQRVVHALPVWRELERETGEQLLDVLPCVNVGTDLDVLYGAMEGVQREVLLEEASAERFPSIRMHLGESMLVEPGAAVIDAAATVRALSASARSHGALISEGCRVIGVVDRPGFAEVTHEDGIIEADVVVVAAGAWAGDLVGEKIPHVRPSAETVIYAPVDGDVPILIERGSVVRYALPVGDGTVRAGFSRGDTFAHPDDGDAIADDDVAAEVLAWLRGRLTVNVGSPTLVQRCMYTMTPDESFVLARSGRVVIASACSGHGFKFAPWTGERVADLVDG